MRNQTILKYFKQANVMSLVHDELEGHFKKKLPKKIFIGPHFSPQIVTWVKENEPKKNTLMMKVLGVPVYFDPEIEGQNVRYDPYKWSRLTV